MMQVVVIVLLGVHLAYAGKHSLKYFYTGVSGDIDFPEFTAVGLVDEVPFMYFDSNAMKAVPKTEWMRQKEGADYWDRETQTGIGTHQTFKNNIQIAKQRFNQSKGVHTLQLMYGCEQDDDGSTRGYYQYGYDGEDFISLDKNTLTWTPANPQAFITKHKWEVDRAYGEQLKGYLENTCIEWLKKYVGYGKDTLEKKVSPQVSLLQKSSSSSVTCHATGFYPSGVTISWMKNGREHHHEDVDLGELLPNEDGTFQKTSTIRVSPEEWKNNKFSCVVEHQGETKTVDKTRTNNAFWGWPVSIPEEAYGGLIQLSDFIKNILIRVPKMNEGLTGLGKHEVSPQVSLLQKSSSSSVTCHATGFYPSGVTISWMKNGEEHHEDVDLSELLPNEDGTFQKTSTIRVSPEEWKNNKFSCVVEHQGETIKSILTEDKIRTNWGDSLPVGIIVGAAAVFLLIVIGGCMRYQKKKDRCLWFPGVVFQSTSRVSYLPCSCSRSRGFRLDYFSSLDSLTAPLHCLHQFHLTIGVPAPLTCHLWTYHHLLHL